jgi:hypothetical protein
MVISSSCMTCFKSRSFPIPQAQRLGLALTTNCETEKRNLGVDGWRVCWEKCDYPAACRCEKRGVIACLFEILISELFSKLVPDMLSDALKGESDLTGNLWQSLEIVVHPGKKSIGILKDLKIGVDFLNAKSPV